MRGDGVVEVGCSGMIVGGINRICGHMLKS